MNSSSKNNNIAVIIVAAGGGTRLGGQVPKAYRHLAGKPLIEHSLAVFSAHPAINRIIVVFSQSHRAYLTKIQENYPHIEIVVGGETRQESVHKGLEYLNINAPNKVLIHDAARPFISTELLNRIINKLDNAQAVLPVIAVTDTIKQIADQQITQTLPRDQLAAAQTPQAFTFHTIYELHQRSVDKSATDDAMLAEWAGIPIMTVEGDRENHKLTYREDWNMAEQTLQSQPSMMLPRIGMGFDVHKLVPHESHTPDRHRVVRICGVDIPCEMQLEGHSDADVGLHSLTDAILGALCEGDIGVHFPPTEPKWRGVDSSIFLLEAMNLLHKHQAVLHHIDITLIAKLPRVSPYREAMRERIAEITGLPLNCVSVKATTTEGLGFTGRGEGIAAQAVATVLAPSITES